ncbi:disease resistance protein RPS4-like [Gossypium australe]|uniref:Disease resistance protein RPS4-like n=1 Tax=Gossypium australe TaxID=47621 RepID=A0A5B6VTC0_9ROSI|nr:disease resistance protein RPS4-like [Gossypium australe]
MIVDGLEFSGVAFLSMMMLLGMKRVVIHCRNSGQVDESDWLGWLLGKQNNQPITKDHLFLRYLTREKLYPFSLGDERETKNLSTIDCSDQDGMSLRCLSQTQLVPVLR